MMSGLFSQYQLFEKNYIVLGPVILKKSVFEAYNDSKAIINMILYQISVITAWKLHQIGFLLTLQDRFPSLFSGRIAVTTQ